MRIDITKQKDAKNISLYKLAKNIGVTYPTMLRIYRGETESIKFDILEALCLELSCTPNDILVFECKDAYAIDDTDVENAG